MISLKVCLGLAAILLAFSYHWFNKSDENEVIDEVIATWRKKITEPDRPFKRVAVGVNANVDVIAKGIEVFKNLDFKPPSAGNDHDTITSVDSLLETFVHFFSTGSAAERYCSSKEVADTLISTAGNTEGVQWYVGGNAALMAQKIVSSFPDRQVQLYGPVGPILRKLLNEKISIPQSSHVKEDEVHIILEYQADEQWGPFQAHRANRFITSHDVTNSQGNMINGFFANFDNFKPDLVIFSGLHLLETQPQEAWMSRLDETAESLSKIPHTLPVHLELASMADEDYMKSLLTKIVPQVASLGLNEQEISFASKVAGGPHSDLMDDSNLPDIPKIGDMVLWLLKTYGYNSKTRPQSKLTRVHFHSLTYHVVGYFPGAWGNVRSAVASGTIIAGQQACDLKELESEPFDLRIPETFNMNTGGKEIVFNASRPVVTWTKEEFKFSFSPVLVCKEPLKTVGLGDAISSTGLLYSEFYSEYKVVQ